MRVIVLGGNQSLRMGMRVLTCQMLRNMQTFLVSRYSPTSCWGRVYGEGKTHPGKVYHLVEVYLPLTIGCPLSLNIAKALALSWSQKLFWKTIHTVESSEILQRPNCSDMVPTQSRDPKSHSSSNIKIIVTARWNLLAMSLFSYSTTTSKV